MQHCVYFTPGPGRSQVLANDKVNGNPETAKRRGHRQRSDVQKGEFNLIAASAVRGQAMDRTYVNGHLFQEPELADKSSDPRQCIYCVP